MDCDERMWERPSPLQETNSDLIGIIFILDIKIYGKRLDQTKL